MLSKIKHTIGFLISTIRSASVYPVCLFDAVSPVDVFML